jgi:predicted CoA-binding protein
MTPLEILGAYAVFAIVGLSDRPDRPSHSVASFLKERGYHIVPVNPCLVGRKILGERCYADLPSIPFPVEVVDIFRRSELVSPIVDQAIAIGARVVWMQLGVTDERAAERARAAGLHVVMDRCPAIELSRAAGTAL